MRIRALNEQIIQKLPKIDLVAVLSNEISASNQIVALGGRALFRYERPCTGAYLASRVTPGHWSVRNGEAGRPSLLYRLQTGLSAQA